MGTSASLILESPGKENPTILNKPAEPQDTCLQKSSAEWTTLFSPTSLPSESSSMKLFLGADLTWEIPENKLETKF